MVVERLTKGRAVVMTADGRFREVKLPERLARREQGAIGHDLGHAVPHAAGLRRPRLILRKRLGWAATAAVCLGILLGTPVRGWLAPFSQLENGGSTRYRLTATVRGSESVWDGGSVPGDLSFTAELLDGSDAGRGYVLSPRRSAPSIRRRVNGEIDAGAPRQGTLESSPVRAVGLTVGTVEATGAQSRPALRQTSRGRPIHARR